MLVESLIVGSLWTLVRESGLLMCWWVHDIAGPFLSCVEITTALSMWQSGQVALAASRGRVEHLEAVCLHSCSGCCHFCSQESSCLSWFPGGSGAHSWLIHDRIHLFFMCQSVEHWFRLTQFINVFTYVRSLKVLWQLFYGIMTWVIQY